MCETTPGPRNQQAPTPSRRGLNNIQAHLELRHARFYRDTLASNRVEFNLLLPPKASVCKRLSALRHAWAKIARKLAVATWELRNSQIADLTDRCVSEYPSKLPPNGGEAGRTEGGRGSGDGRLGRPIRPGNLRPPQSHNPRASQASTTRTPQASDNLACGDARTHLMRTRHLWQPRLGPANKGASRTCPLSGHEPPALLARGERAPAAHVSRRGPHLGGGRNPNGATSRTICLDPETSPTRPTTGGVSPRMRRHIRCATYKSSRPKNEWGQVRTSGMCHTGHYARRAHFNMRGGALWTRAKPPLGLARNSEACHQPPDVTPRAAPEEGQQRAVGRVQVCDGTCRHRVVCCRRGSREGRSRPAAPPDKGTSPTSMARVTLSIETSSCTHPPAWATHGRPTMLILTSS